MSGFVEKLAQNRRRLIVGAVIGLLLGILTIWFCSTIYDPFMGDVGELRLLVPDDAEFVIEAPDFPSLVKGLENRTFFGRLHRNDAFQRYLDADDDRRRAMADIRDAWRRLQSAGAELPFGLELLGEVSGTQVVVAGRFPQEAGGVPPFVVLTKPDAATPIMAANVLMDETLYGWFMEGELDGATIDHHEWGIIVHTRSTNDAGAEVVLDIALARVENVLVWGTDTGAVKRIWSDYVATGLPVVPAGRLRPKWAWDGAEGTSVNIALRQASLTKLINLHADYLIPLWGLDTAQLFSSLFPPFDDAGEAWLKLDLDEYAELRFAVGSRPRREPVSVMDPLDRGAVLDQVDGVMGSMPHHTFGYLYARTSPGDMAAFCLSNPDIVDRDKRSVWFAELAQRLPRFGDSGTQSGETPDLTSRIQRELDELLADEVGVALFRKDRVAEVPDTSPGMGIIFRMRDRNGVEALLREIDTALAGNGARVLERYDYDGAALFEIANRTWLDDPVNNRPGFAIIGDFLVVTNWFPAIHDTIQVQRRRTYESRAMLNYHLDRLAPSSSTFLFVDPHQLYGFMDDVKEGWVHARAEISEQEKFTQHQSLLAQAEARGMSPDAADAWIQPRYEQWVELRRREKNPTVIRRDIDTTLNYFRGAFSFFFLSLGLDGSRFQLEVKLGADEAR